MFTDIFKKYSDYGLISLRIGLGVVFLLHGIGKLLAVGPFAAGISGTAGFFTNVGIPAAMLFAWIVALVETFSGLAILGGFQTRLASLLVAVDMLIAFLVVHISNGFNVANGGGELVWALFFGAVTLMLLGPGKKWSVDKN